MTIGKPSVFAIESEIHRAFEQLSLRGLGFFVIHVRGRQYGIKSPSQTMLACSFDEVERRISERGTHEVPFANEDAAEIANAYTRAVYFDHDAEVYFELSEARFKDILISSGAVWAPDGDEAFDDSSYVLQFDVVDQVRLIAFKRANGVVDATSVRELWIPSAEFYGTLQKWRDAFLREWESLPKHSC